jgi:hypothetical protein
MRAAVGKLDRPHAIIALWYLDESLGLAGRRWLTSKADGGGPEDVRAQVEAAANNAGHSIAEEIRRRLERTFRHDAIDPKTCELTDAVALLAHLVKLQTGHTWFDHQAAASVLKHAIDTRLARVKGGDGKAVFDPSELPSTENRYLAVQSDDPQVVGSILAGVAHFLVLRERVFGREVVKNMTEEEARTYLVELRGEDR